MGKTKIGFDQFSTLWDVQKLCQAPLYEGITLQSEFLPGLEANCASFAFQLCRLYKFIEQKGELQDLTPTINSLIKQKTGVAQLVKYGLKDLEEVVGLLKKLGIKLQVWPPFDSGSTDLWP